MLMGSASIFATMAPGAANGLMEPLELVMMNADYISLDSAGFGAFFNNLALHC
ncbi:MAG: hypothetical protein MO846_02380 [Candidatus Devosia symbiotica]|nr:hypothetical protein [Candidatus Devosia symbiotica]